MNCDGVYMPSRVGHTDHQNHGQPWIRCYSKEPHHPESHSVVTRSSCVTIEFWLRLEMVSSLSGRQFSLLSFFLSFFLPSLFWFLCVLWIPYLIPFIFVFDVSSHFPSLISLTFPAFSHPRIPPLSIIWDRLDTFDFLVRPESDIPKLGLVVLWFGSSYQGGSWCNRFTAVFPKSQNCNHEWDRGSHIAWCSYPNGIVDPILQWVPRHFLLTWFWHLPEPQFQHAWESIRRKISWSTCPENPS